MLSQLVEPDARVFVLSGHTVMGFLGTSAGALTSGLLITGLTRRNWTDLEAYRAVFLLYSVAAVIKVAISVLLSSGTELKAVTAKRPAADERRPLLDEERRSDVTQDARRPSIVEAILTPPGDLPLPRLPIGRLIALCLIFSLDSFASSIMPNSYISYYFKVAFNAPLSVIAITFSVGSVLGGLSQVSATLWFAWTRQKPYTHAFHLVLVSSFSPESSPASLASFVS